MNSRCIVLLVLSLWLLHMGWGAAADAPVLRVGHVGHDHHLALFVAADRGEALREEAGGFWLREQKAQDTYDLMSGDTILATLRLTKVGGGANMPSALAREEIAIGLGGIAPTLFAIDHGAPLKVIAPLNSNGDMLMLHPSQPPRTWDEFIASLRTAETPLRIGYKAPKAVAYLIFQEALKAEGIPYSNDALTEDGRPAQVILVNLQKGANMIPSLAAGEVDGIVMNQPVVALAEEKGVGVVVADLKDLPPAGRWHQHPCCGVVASLATLEAHPEVTRALLALVAESGRWIVAHPQASAEIAHRWTGKPLAVEQRSVLTVMYVAAPDAAWREGMMTWLSMMNQNEFFREALGGLTEEEQMVRVLDLRFVSSGDGVEAASEE